jgi:ArsR family transcriptional regulator
MTPDPINDLASMFRLMGDATRLSILFAVIDGPRPVAEIAQGIGASASLVSHHLRLLRGGRIVRAERRGQQVFYALDDAHIGTVLRDMMLHAREDQGAEDRLAKRREARRKRRVA